MASPSTYMAVDRVSPSLKQRVFRAGGWNVAGAGLSQAIRFLSNLIMTRLLVPEAFGVMAIATMIMIGLIMFSDVGLRQNIVQSKRGNDVAFLNTAWVIQILRGVLLWCVALGVSLLLVLANRIGMVPAESVYAEPSLPYVITVLSISAIIMGFESTKLLEASRHLLLGRVTQIELGSQLVGLLCMVAWVTFDRSIWALVVGSICASLTKTLLSHVWLPGTANQWRWQKEAISEIFHFGKWIFLSSIFGFLVNSGDRLLLGGLINTTELGVYVIAFLIFSSVDQVLAKIMGDVAYPALSEVARERPADLKATYYRFHSVLASFTFFCAGVLIIAGHSLIDLLYDDRYAQAGWMLEILAIGLLTLPFRIATQCFMALGMPSLLTYTIAVRLVTLFLVTPIGFHFFGLPGALYGILISHFSYVPIIVFFQVKHGLFNMRSELLPLPLLMAGLFSGKMLQLALGHP